MIEIQGPATALADEPFTLRARGAGPDAELAWHARMRDDDGLVWRARAARPEDLPGAWRGKAERAALASLRPLRIDVRVEAADGQSASRTLTRLLVAEGVRVRRWRDGPVATLHLPAGAPSASVLVDGVAGVAPALARLPRRARPRRRERRSRRRPRAPRGGAGRSGRGDADGGGSPGAARPAGRATPARGPRCWPDCVRRNADAPGYRGPRPDVPHADVTTTARPRGLYATDVGKKDVMAISGIVLMLFVLAHMVGNLKIYLGADSLNAYSHWLRDIGEPAVPPRGPALDHAHRAARRGLRAHPRRGAADAMNRRARPVGYEASREYAAADFAAARCAGPASSSRSSSIFHLLDLTWGTANPDFARGDVYHNVVASFERVAGRDRLHPREPRARPAPVPRRLEPVPDPRQEQPALQRVAPLLRMGVRGGHRRRQHLVPHRGRDRGGLTAECIGDARRARSRRARSRRSGTTTASTHEAGQPGEQAQVRRHRRRHRAGRRVGRGDARRARLQREVVLLPRLARGARTRSPRRAASTRRRTTRTTATASTGSSTTRSRAATSARARPTSTGWPRSASTSSTSASAQGVPFAREYGGLLDNRSFGGAQVSRTFYARGQTGQQLLLGAYQALERQIDAGTVKMHHAHEMLDLVVVDGRARGHRHARPRHRRDRARTAAHAVVLATGGYGNVFYLSTNAKGCNVTAIWRAHKRGRAASPTRATRRSIRPASRQPATTSRSSR